MNKRTDGKLFRERVSVLVEVEQHLRMFAPIISRGATVYYRPNGRLGHLSLPGNRIVNSANFLGHFLDSKNKVFLTPLHIGYHSHPFISNLPRYQEYKENYNDIPSSMGIMNEVVHFAHPSYQHSSHFSFCRTVIEPVVYREPRRIYITGDPSLSNISLIPNRGSQIAMLLSYDGSRQHHADPLLDKMLEDLHNALERVHHFTELYIKDHPGSIRNDYIPKVEDFCKRHNLTLKVLNPKMPIEDIAKYAKIALVQASLSSHFILIRRGVESFAYIHEHPGNWDTHFAKANNMPQWELSNRYEESYSFAGLNEWTDKTFCITIDPDALMTNAMISELNHAATLQ